MLFRSDLLETQTGELITATVPSNLLDKWRHTLAEFRADGQIQQSWLWEAPAKHSTVQIAQVFELAGQYRDGLEHDADAGCCEPVGQSASSD